METLSLTLASSAASTERLLFSTAPARPREDAAPGGLC
jgi:hypothetical protein